MDPEELAKLLRSVSESLERIGPAIATLSAAPAPLVQPTAQPVGIQSQAAAPIPQTRILSLDDQMQLRRELRQMSTPELHMLFAKQASKGGNGIPLGVWMGANGALGGGVLEKLQQNVDPDIARAIDTGAASALIRQDLEPVLYELYIRTFPAYERFQKEPSNGLLHAFNQVTSFGAAQFMSELGTVTDDQSTYVRQFTNIAILATRRGVSLKSQFAVLAGGMSGFNPEGLELTGGLRSISKKMQQTIFGGQATDSGGDADNELGLYDADGFTGLRSILNSPRAKDIDPGTNPLTTGRMRRGFNQSSVEIMQQGGTASMIYLSPLDKEVFDDQQDQNVRYTGDTVNVAVGVNANVVNTVFGPLPLFPVAGDAISSYHRGGVEYRDAYLLDESTFTLPYLGSPGPTVLDIPIGVSGQLTRLMIIFMMNGFAAKAPVFSNKLRIKVQA